MMGTYTFFDWESVRRIFSVLLTLFVAVLCNFNEVYLGSKYSFI